ncbi:MAG: hypothetical protein RL213_919 [Bacteroidota bacterium]
MLLVLFTSCNEHDKIENISGSLSQEIPVSKKDSDVILSKPTVSGEVDKNIRSIFQDNDDNYWFGTNGAGVYRYNGQTLTHYTVKEGLPHNQIQSIQEDSRGDIWFGTGAFGVCRFDGKTFTTFTDRENLTSSNGADHEWEITQNDLWFYAGGGVYHYNGNSFVYLPLSKTGFATKQSQSSPFNLSRYAVYSILKDKKGNVWFGTQAEGVCRYDGKTFTWFTEKGLSGSAVLCLFEDSKGNLWFGNNGSGLFRWDGKSLINFTDEKGLSNEEFKVSGKSGPGTMARIYAINEDDFGNLWIGTVDAGVWKYDGNRLTNYTIKNGLTSDAVNFIYKDHSGVLWFGTDGDGICKFNGNTFSGFKTEKEKQH